MNLWDEPDVDEAENAEDVCRHDDVWAQRLQTESCPLGAETETRGHKGLLFPSRRGRQEVGLAAARLHRREFYSSKAQIVVFFL